MEFKVVVTERQGAKRTFRGNRHEVLAWYGKLQTEPAHVLLIDSDGDLLLLSKRAPVSLDTLDAEMREE